MKHLRRAVLATALLSTATAFLAFPVHAESLASSASSAGSASSGSISDSISSSSNSSKDNKVAAGQYRVIDIAQAPGRADKLRLTLHAAEAGRSDQFFLDVPQRALDGLPLAAGSLVDVRERPYGYEFAAVTSQRPFFLALHDDWYSELRSNAL